MGFTDLITNILSSYQTETIVAFVRFGLYVLYAIGCWKVLVKMGDKGWKALIPFYNKYLIYKYVWKTSRYWVALVLWILASLSITINTATGSTYVDVLAGFSLVCSFLGLIWNFIKTQKLAKSFQKGFFMGLLTFLLEDLMMIIYGFGKAEYKKIN